ncbi:NBS-LRR disease resistance protein homologue [Striga asiatica]|uniref:NBS-LRR disease resistance protein homologue n=1 Tax=Striga asiatica TaxID=4170 RepID=A0A5A7QYK5_STRAF|nr:NBS-LRR disease resistance protein homologue [Striga asiatica]
MNAPLHLHQTQSFCRTRKSSDQLLSSASTTKLQSLQSSPTHSGNSSRPSGTRRQTWQCPHRSQWREAPTRKKTSLRPWTQDVATGDSWSTAATLPVSVMTEELDMFLYGGEGGGGMLMAS